MSEKSKAPSTNLVGTTPGSRKTPLWRHRQTQPLPQAEQCAQAGPMGRQWTGGAVQPLTTAELTQGFLLHEEQLALLQPQTCLV